MMKPSLKQAVAETSVFWDIKTYPVPHGCDAGVVGPCIQQYLKKLGYSGPLTIIAVGLLTDVPGDVLRALSSTGIVLSLVPLGSIAILETIYEWFDSNPPPANMMIISSDPSIFPECRHFSKYNIFELFPYASPNPQSLWNNFLLERAPKVDKYESASWLCSVCYIHGKGFENFTTHLSTPEHIEEATLKDKETVAVTLVIWDIKSCPLPPGCNARWVAPSIKQYLKDLGYSGPLIIIAIGQLKDYPDDILQTLSSTGILLNHYDAFTSVNSMRVINPWTNLYSPPANMMFICPYSKDFTNVVAHLRFVLGYSIIEPFPDGSPYSESLWRSFLLQDSGTLEEDECSGTNESASWFCSVCDLPGKGFETFTTHISSQEHKEEVTQMDKEIVAVTSVLWDIKGCPVPPNFSASLVAPCIKKYLEGSGYSGPLTISAIGQLQNVPDNVLLAVSSTGIVLNQYDAYNSGRILPYLYLWRSSYLPPADILVLFPYSEDLPKVLGDLDETGYNIINPFPYDSSDSKSLWEKILLQVSETLEEDECSESGEHASWVCSVCNIFGKGFENFTMHLSRKVHKQKMSVYQSDEKHEEAVKAGAEASPNSHPKNATKKQGQKKKNKGRKRK